MTGRQLRYLLLGLGIFAVVAVSPLESSACCFSRRAFAGYAPPAPYVVGYAPAIVAPMAPACNTCNYAPAPLCSTCAPAPVCNTCNYVPQTAYRTVYTNVPVTTFRPITTADPCTGCATTVMQPVTSFALQPRLVAYTSYQQVCSPVAPACPTGACGSAMATPVSATYAAAAPMPAAAPACCGNGVSAVSPAPSLNAAPAFAAAQPSLSTSTVSTPAQPVFPAQQFTPAPATTPSTPRKTFMDDAPAATPDSGVETKSSGTILPRLADPQDRTTSLTPARPYRQVSAKVTATADSSLSDDGWRAARR